MNIYINMRNKRKMVEKNGRVRTTLPKCQLLTILDYQTCYQIKVDTLHFNQRRMILPEAYSFGYMP